jgi:mono/diheme cytochrome c family protein
MNHRSIYPRSFSAGLVVLAVMLVAGCSTAPQQKRVTGLLAPAPVPENAIENLAPTAVPDVVKGGQIYAVKCQPCHGDSGQGDGTRASQIKTQGGQVAKLVNSALAQKASPAAWFDIVTNGRIDKLMPGFSQSLTPQDRWDVLSYVWAMGVNTTTLLATRQTYLDACQACHGLAGLGDGPQLGAAKVVSFGDGKWLAHASLLDVSAAMIKGTAHVQVKLDEPTRLALANLVRTFGYRYSDPYLTARTVITGNGVLRLQAVNRTPNGQAVTGLPVILHTYDTTGEVFSRTAPLDVTGVVTFTALSDDPNLFYQADVTYSGARFYAPPAQFSGTLELTDTIPVFEVTTDPGVITTSEFHYFVQDVGEGTLNIVEFYIYENSSDRAYIDKPGPDGTLRSLKVNLPADATKLRFDGPGLGSRFFQDGLTIYDSDAVPPGKRATTIAMIYDVPYRNRKDITRNMSYPVKAWDVFLPDNVMRVSGMADKGLQAIQTSSIRMYVPDKPDIKAGADAVFTMTGQPRGVSIPGEDNTAITFGFVALLLAIAGAFFMVTRIRRWRTVDVDLAQEKVKLLQEISELDSRFAAGKIKETEYQGVRRELKDQLREIWE